MTTRFPALIISGMLLWALAPQNPYGYYTLLRVTVFVFLAYCAFREFRNAPDHPKPWVATALAIIYNPFESFALGRPLWNILNLVTVGVIFWIEFTKSKRPES
jgi:hypothetical protein